MQTHLLRTYLTETFGIKERALDLAASCEKRLCDRFAQIDELAQFHQARVMHAFQENNVAARHFFGSSGYGYSDDGRDNLAKVYADVFGTEDAIVSPLIMSGTHALSEALFGVLRPGDTLLCITGEPYDTLQPVIRGAAGSLADFGIRFTCIPRTAAGAIDISEARRVLREDPSIRIVYLQRSTGYDIRPAFTTGQIADAVDALKASHPAPVYMVDNCYGEFVNEKEPTQCGADLMAGSLIKNPGGGAAPTGGYIAGRRDLVELAAARYSAPGIGREVGSYLPGYQAFYEGLFLAPHTVAQALKGVILAAEVFAELGYEVLPSADADRGDITQTILFRNPEALTAFVRGIQKASPVDSHVVPYAWDMPGYKDQVIMAAGTFVQGASLEFTADGPMREPYAAYLQGGLTYEHAYLGILFALNDLCSRP